MLYFGSQETSLDEMLSQGHTASTWQDWDSGVALSLGEGPQGWLPPRPRVRWLARAPGRGGG